MAQAPKSGGMNVDTKLVKRLADLLEESGLSEIEVEDEGQRIRVARTMAAASAPPVAAAPSPAPAATPPTEENTDLRNHAGAIKSPMVGTVYLSSEPGAKPFVSEGDQVAEGDTILIVEAMKVMNPITAPRPGKITKICVANEQPVEFDEVLAIIE